MCPTYQKSWFFIRKEIDRRKAWEAYEKVRKSKIKGTTSGGRLFYCYLEILNVSLVYDVKVSQRNMLKFSFYYILRSFL